MTSKDSVETHLSTTNSAPDSSDDVLRYSVQFSRVALRAGGNELGRVKTDSLGP